MADLRPLNEVVAELGSHGSFEFVVAVAEALERGADELASCMLIDLFSATVLS